MFRTVAVVVVALCAFAALAQDDPRAAKRKAIEAAKQAGRAESLEKAEDYAAGVVAERALEQELLAKHDAGVATTKAAAAPAAPAPPPVALPTDIVQEMERHELREAMLARISYLAQTGPDRELEIACRRTRAKENERHTLVLARLKAQAKAR